MGSQHSAELRSRINVGKPVVVVVGGGYGGVAAATALDKTALFNVILLERKDFFFHNIAALRASVQEGWESRTIVPYDKLFQKGGVIAVHCEVTAIRATEVVVHGIGDASTEETIKFDYLVLATGSSYAFPAKVPFPNWRDAIAAYAEIREIVRQSKSIVVVGGGPVGIELSGELAMHSDAKVTLLEANDTLLSQHAFVADKLRKKIARQLRAAGVDVRLGARVDVTPIAEDIGSTRYRYLKLEGDHILYLHGGQVIRDVDLVLFANGAHVNNGSWSSGALSTAVNAETGRLRVNPHFQVQGYENVFAVGDIVDGQRQFGYIAAHHGQHVAANIVAHHKRQALKPVPQAPAAIVLPIGEKAGASQLPLLGATVVGEGATSIIKGKKLFTDMFFATLHYKMPPVGVEHVLQPRTARAGDAEADVPEGDAALVENLAAAVVEKNGVVDDRARAIARSALSGSLAVVTRTVDATHL